MADINHVITLGIGTPGAIEQFILFGLNADGGVTPPDPTPSGGAGGGGGVIGGGSGVKPFRRSRSGNRWLRWNQVAQEQLDTKLALDLEARKAFDAYALQANKADVDALIKLQNNLKWIDIESANTKQALEAAAAQVTEVRAALARYHSHLAAVRERESEQKLLADKRQRQADQLNALTSIPEDVWQTYSNLLMQSKKVAARMQERAERRKKKLQ